jgi:Ca-activated chloride channel homolog
MFDYHFEHIWVLILSIPALAAYLYLNIRGRKLSVIPYPPIQYKKKRALPNILYISSVVLESLLIIILFMSLAKPYRSSETISIEEEGLDIVLVVDVSASMQANDFNPNRLEATKLIVKDFVRRSAGNRIGILVFGKHVFTLSPLTTDHLVLHELIDGLSLNTIDHYRSGGTAVGDAILRGTEVMKNSKIPDRSQVLILLTDGDSNIGSKTELATKYAVDNDIRIHTIGLGSTALIRVVPNPKRPDWFFDTKLVEEPLKKIAQAANGRYFHAKNDGLLADIFNEIAMLERTPLEIDRIQQHKYLRYPLNITISILFLITLLTKVLWLRRPLK